MIEDNRGRSLLDMIYYFMPSYVETFQVILEKVFLLRSSN